MESSKPVAAEQMPAKQPKTLDDRKVPEEVGGRAKPPKANKARTRPASDLGPKHKD